MKENNKKALLREPIKTYHKSIIPQYNPKFALQDFSKSGISSDITKDYINNEFLIGDFETWDLFYPDLKTNQKTSYKTTRFKNRVENKYIRTKGKTSQIFKQLQLAPKILNNTNEYIILTEGNRSG